MPPPPPPPRKAQPPAAKGGQAAPAAALLQPVQTRAAPFGAPPEASGGFGVRARPPPASPSGPAFGAAAFAQKRAPLSGGGGAAAGAPFVLPSWSPPPLQSQDGEAMMLSRAQDADLDGAGAAAAGAVAAVKPPPDPSAGCLSAVVSRLVEGGHAGAQPLVVGGGAAASAADDAAGSTAAIVAAAEARLLQLLPAALAPDKGLSVEGSAVAAAVAGLGERANVAQASGAAAVDAFASHTRGAVFEVRTEGGGAG